jgi:hypothetical protein
MQGVPYNKAIGSILWPAIVSRPDIAYAVGVLSQFIQNLGHIHWEAVKRVIVYVTTSNNVSELSLYSRLVLSETLLSTVVD